MDGGVICVILTVETQDSVELLLLLAADGDSAGPSTAHTVPGQTQTLSPELNVILIIFGERSESPSVTSGAHCLCILCMYVLATLLAPGWPHAMRKRSWPDQVNPWPADICHEKFELG